MTDFDWNNPPEGHDHKRKTLFENVMWASENLDKIEPKYSIVWHKYDGEVAAVTTPAPEWLAMAMHGGLLPAIEVYDHLQTEWTNTQGETIRTRINEHPGPEWSGGSVVNGWLLHACPRAPSMTEEQAMEYLLQKDIPIGVWHDHATANRRRFVICKREQIPKCRKLRNAWKLTQPGDSDA